MTRTHGWLTALCIGLGGVIPALAQDEEGIAEDFGAASEDAGDGLPLYAGVEFAQTRVEFGEDDLQAAFGGRRFDSDFYKLRVGARVFEGVGLEAQVGVPASDSGEGELETSQYYGLFLVPTGVFMDMVEISARIGYSIMSVENDLADEDLDGMSFALAIELPLRALGESLPDLRLTGSGAVFQEDRDARVYGYTLGLRYDFSL